MPAHIRTMLTDSSLSIPVIEGRLTLGTWQGIYLIEHRDRPHHRGIVLHAIGARAPELAVRPACYPPHQEPAVERRRSALTSSHTFGALSLRSLYLSTR